MLLLTIFLSIKSIATNMFWSACMVNQCRYFSFCIISFLAFCYIILCSCRMDKSNRAILFIEKPKPSDAFSIKERYIQTKVSSLVLPFMLDQPADALSIINIWPVMHLYLCYRKLFWVYQRSLSFAIFLV